MTPLALARRAAKAARQEILANRWMFGPGYDRNAEAMAEAVGKAVMRSIKDVQQHGPERLPKSRGPDQRSETVPAGEKALGGKSANAEPVGASPTQGHVVEQRRTVDKPFCDGCALPEAICICPRKTEDKGGLD